MLYEIRVFPNKRLRSYPSIKRRTIPDKRAVEAVLATARNWTYVLRSALCQRLTLTNLRTHHPTS